MSDKEEVYKLVGLLRTRNNSSVGFGLGPVCDRAAEKLLQLVEENERLTARLSDPKWKLVPIEPTEEMIAAAKEDDREYTRRNFGDIPTVMQGPYDHYCAMVAAATLDN